MTWYARKLFYDLLADESMEPFKEDSSGGSNHIVPNHGEASEWTHPLFERAMSHHTEILTKQPENSSSQHMPIVKVGTIKTMR